MPRKVWVENKEVNMSTINQLFGAETWGINQLILVDMLIGISELLEIHCTMYTYAYLFEYINGS